jgi:hypothetical protein
LDGGVEGGHGVMLAGWVAKDSPENRSTSLHAESF